VRRHTRNSAWADGNREWAAELAGVLAAHGLPWQASSCWCDQRTATWCAELTNQANGDMRTITVPTAQTATAATRQAEIVRQLRET
jgi:hypothetical protein